MAETIENGKWLWQKLPADLKQQADYEGIRIDTFSMSATSCFGSTTKGNKFKLTWKPGRLMMISLLKDEQVLIDAFAKVVEYEPFCKYQYISNGFITYEWAKKDSKDRFEKLQQDSNIDELQLL